MYDVKESLRDEVRVIMEWLAERLEAGEMTVSQYLTALARVLASRKTD